MANSQIDDIEKKLRELRLKRIELETIGDPSSIIHPAQDPNVQKRIVMIDAQIELLEKERAQIVTARPNKPANASSKQATVKQRVDELQKEYPGKQMKELFDDVAAEMDESDSSVVKAAYYREARKKKPKK